MNATLLGFLTFGGALALSVYGVKLQSEGLQKLSSGWVRHVLSAMSGNRLKGVLAGFAAALLVQSSSATTLMVVGFVNAEILTLAQAVTVLMGANVGATLTGWIVAWLGFDWAVGLYALPVIACAVPLIFSTNSRRRAAGDVLLGLSLLFIGLSMLRGTVPQAVSRPDVYVFWAELCQAGFLSVLLFTFLGAVTVVGLQSSQASLIVVMLVASAGWIPFEMAVAMVLGVNLGAAVPPLIASLPANVTARRAAMAHFLFNAVGTLWALALFRPLVKLVSLIVAATGTGDPLRFYQLLGEVDLATLTRVTSSQAVLTPNLLDLQTELAGARMASVYGVALFHTLFNTLNTLALAPFDRYLVQMASRMVPATQEEEMFRLTYLGQGSVSTAELSLLQADKEISVYAKRCARMYGMVRSLYSIADDTEYQRVYERVEKYEEICDRMEVELANYLTRSSDTRLSDGAKHDVLVMLQTVSGLERVADGCHSLAKSIGRRRAEAIPYTEETDSHMDGALSRLSDIFDTLLQLLQATDFDTRCRLAENARGQAAGMESMMEELRARNAADVNERKYPYQVSVTYMSMLDNCAKISASVLAVEEQYRQTRKGTM